MQSLRCLANLLLSSGDTRGRTLANSHPIRDGRVGSMIKWKSMVAVSLKRLLATDEWVP